MFQPREYQNEAVSSIFSYFGNGGMGNPVVAMPTGTGKSSTIGMFVKQCILAWPRQRFMMATHVSDLIVQNAEALLEQWEHAPLGIHSSGLRQRDVGASIIYGGVQTMKNCPEAFGWRDILLIDEAHLLSPKDSSNYRLLIAALMKINPQLRIIGFTATPYRTGQGLITDPVIIDGNVTLPIFTDICFDITGLDAFNRLIAQGFLCPPIVQKTDVEVDVSDLHLGQDGDYVVSELNDAVNHVLYPGLLETVQRGRHRNKWLVFTSGVENADAAAAILRSLGINAESLHSKKKYEGLSKQKTHEVIVEAYKRGDIKALCVNNKMTTGFNVPEIDLIAMFRSTVSTGLWVQMVGRGTRMALWAGKINCLVLDFAGNRRRLGPINDPIVPRGKGKKTGDAPVRICDVCGVYNHASARKCEGCGAEFEIASKILETAQEEPILASELPVIEHFPVSRVLYLKGQKDGKPPYMKVCYYSGLRMFQEIVCLEHEGFAGKKARDWWRARYPIAYEPPETTEAALKFAGDLMKPKTVRVWVNKSYPEVMGHEF